jgi:hypothetical protein
MTSQPPDTTTPAATPTSDAPEAEKPLGADLKELRKRIEQGFAQETEFNKSQPKSFTDEQGINLPQPDDSALEENDPADESSKP